MSQQQPKTLDPEQIGARVRPLHTHDPSDPVYRIIGKIFRLEYEDGIPYNVAYYQLQNVLTGEISQKLVPAYLIVMAF